MLFFCSLLRAVQQKEFVYGEWKILHFPVIYHRKLLLESANYPLGERIFRFFRCTSILGDFPNLKLNFALYWNFNPSTDCKEWGCDRTTIKWRTTWRSYWSCSRGTKRNERGINLLKIYLTHVGHDTSKSYIKVWNLELFLNWIGFIFEGSHSW